MRDTKNIHNYDCIVIGGGHAGIEAALAASRMNCKTLMVTFRYDTIGEMSCNPAIGGIGKGQLVKEIDALGGEIAKAADKTAVQFRQLNVSKGQAVRSSRCQSDRKRYKLYMQRVVKNQKNLSVLADEATDILVKAGHIIGIKTASGKRFSCRTIIVATGTFLNGRIHVGKVITPAGRINEPASTKLADSLKNLGFEIWNFKTGTPPRLDGRTIDFKKLEIQYSDAKPVPFSFKTRRIPKNRKLLPCYLTYTDEKTHEIIRANFNLSPMYSGQIHATGVRYCPSIEDKLKKFPDKIKHTVFLEPEGLDTDLYYPNGISTGLPAEVQEKMVHSIKGLERTKITRYGYSIEHGVVPPTEVTHYLETKKIKGLFFAGQINGTTGYEEAAAQGIVAGINAALKVNGKNPFVLGRDEAYIGVLIDDLTTKGTEEPYRMFTSRVEYRLLIREDNADKRLAHYGHQFGLISNRDYTGIKKKYAFVEKGVEHLRNTQAYPGSSIDRRLKQHNSSPLKRPTRLSDILKRPGITYNIIAPFVDFSFNKKKEEVPGLSVAKARTGNNWSSFLNGTAKGHSINKEKTDNGKLKKLPQEIIDQVEYEIKFEGFIEKQLKDVERFKHIENIKIPQDINYSTISGLSKEICEKLKRFAPVSLGQANRISGVTPAAISILMIHLKKRALQRAKAAEHP